MFAGQGTSATAPSNRPPVPEAIRHQPTPYLEFLEPSFALRWPTPPAEGVSPYALIGLELPVGVDLDRKPPDDGEGDWVEAPQKKFERLMYECRVEVGLILTPASVRLVYRPEGQQSGYITWPVAALLAPSGRLACSALERLLNHRRLFTLPTRQRLHGILAESRKFQNIVTNELAQQVLAALFELLRGIEAADHEDRQLLLAGLRTKPGRDAPDLRGDLDRPDAAGLSSLRRGARDVSRRRVVRPELRPRRPLRPIGRG